MKLSNGFHDPTFVREMLSYEIARDYMPAPKSTYANVFINGNQIGLYVCVQSIDDDFTNENFYERKGPFFKADVTYFQVPGCPSTQAGIWEFFTDTLCYQTVSPYSMLTFPSQLYSLFHFHVRYNQDPLTFLSSRWA